VNIEFHHPETTRAQNDFAAATSRHDDRGMLIFVMRSSRRHESFEPGLQQYGIKLLLAGFGAVHKLHGASRTRCGGDFEPCTLLKSGVETLGTPPTAAFLPVSSTVNP
jgi:hypothetical protein